ncbi:50S ribosomal protein L9 [Pontiella sulfatireligans]|uniref:Large ribosomal subunit protein bL9 n=1 Tax=Pontiella sulfatireligans TaxID=2750658 RepID=A0A6C2UJR2_9BACT|nr:50S ribosomal protein L9 [Pontiella sulfatireligans]VGO20338.1 50S ribosomal protein L9 [Pontiella sulfatireligans]
MAIEVLLMDQVEGLGIEGDVVKVADGYARNFLFPKGVASEVTEGKKRQIEKKRLERLAVLKKEQSAAEELAKKIEGLECTISAKVGENGKMFGSVTVPQILEKLKEQGLEIDRSKISLAAPLHELGVFDVAIKLHPEVVGTLKVWIVEEK